MTAIAPATRSLERGGSGHPCTAPFGLPSRQAGRSMFLLTLRRRNFLSCSPILHDVHFCASMWDSAEPPHPTGQGKFGECSSASRAGHCQGDGNPVDWQAQVLHEGEFRPTCSPVRSRPFHGSQVRQRILLIAQSSGTAEEERHKGLPLKAVQVYLSEDGAQCLCYGSP